MGLFEKFGVVWFEIFCLCCDWIVEEVEKESEKVEC